MSAITSPSCGSIVLHVGGSLKAAGQTWDDCQRAQVDLELVLEVFGEVIVPVGDRPSGVARDPRSGRRQTPARRPPGGRAAASRSRDLPKTGTFTRLLCRHP